MIYKITKDIDLGNGILTIPDNCTLDFQGGSFNNGTIVGSNTKIKAGLTKIFDNITINGTWNNDNSYLEWFNLVNSKYPINEALKLSNNLRLLKKYIFCYYDFHTRKCMYSRRKYYRINY